MQVFEEDYLPLLDDNARKYLRSVKSATKRMSGLIRSLLSFSRLGHNKKLVYVDCGKIVEEVIADLDTVIQISNAVIEVASPLPHLNVYEIEIRQLFQNLIINAIKFQKKDTRPEIRIRAERIDQNWRFSVSDNGIGIAAVHFERVFDIFQRLHTREYDGSGIGLANCKKIVHLHQGEIWVESTPGLGTTFYFTIPTLTI
jgi:light-regulated signal transduction histidine kinase (bacteriophytochrome)